MKKYLFICLALLSIAAVWARDAELANAEKFDIKADATVSWGIDFGRGTGDAYDRYQTHGFKNQQSWEVKFPIFKKGTNTSTRPENARVYGEIMLKDIELGVISKHDAGSFAPTGSVGSLEAKFVCFGAYLQVYNKPGFKSSYANFWSPIVGKSYYHTDAYKFDPGWEAAYGTKLGYKNDNYMGLDVGVKIGSNNTWNPSTVKKAVDKKKGKVIAVKQIAPGQTVPAGEIWVDQNTPYTEYGPGTAAAANTYVIYEAVDKKEDVKDPVHSKYALGLDFSMKPLKEKLEFSVTFNTLFDPAKTYAKDLFDKNLNKKEVYMNAGAEIKSEPVKNLKLKLGFDGGWAFETTYWDKDSRTLKHPDVFAWDMLFDASYKWISGGLYAASEGTPCYGEFRRSDAYKRTADIGIYAKFETKADEKDAANLLKNLNAGASIGMYRLITTANEERADSRLQLPLAMKVWADYKIGLTDAMWIKPFFEFWGETGHTKHSGYRTGYLETDGDPTKAAATETYDPYFGIAYSLGVTYQPVEKVELTAKWDHGKLKEDNYHMISDTANHDNHRGTFVLSCKVNW